MENKLTTGREFVEELASRGLSLVYKREIDLKLNGICHIFAYKWTDENHKLINDIYCRNEWNEPVFVRYDGGIYMDLPLPNITVEFIEEGVEERVSYYCSKYLDAEGWEKKGNTLLEWHKAMIYDFRIYDDEWYLYETFEKRFWADVEADLYRYIDNTKEVADKVEEVFEWYNAAKCAISDGATA